MGIEYLLVTTKLHKIPEHTTSRTFKADGLQQPRTTLGATPVSQERETEDGMYSWHGLTKLHNQRLQKCCLVC